MQEKKYEIDMTEGNLLKKIIMFVIPLIASNVLQLLYNAADVIVVGKFAGSDSLAAVGSNGAFINLLVNFFIGFSIGSTVLISRKYGQRDNEGISRASHTAIAISGIFGFIVLVVGVLFSRKILILMDTPSNVLDKACIYLQIYFMSAPANLIYNFGSAILRSVGDTKRPLIFSVIAGCINVILNLILVIYFKMDVAGVAIATSVSMCVSAVLVMITLIKSDAAYKIVIKDLKIYREELVEIIKIGLPAGLQSSLFAISNIIIQSTVNSFGSVVMAGNAASANVEGFIYMTMNSFLHGSMTATGQNLGAGNFKRIRRTFLICITTVSIVGFACGMLAYIFGNQILSIYANEPEVIAYGMIRLSIFGLTYFTCGIMDTMTGSIRGLGSSFVPMVVSLIGSCVLRIVWIYTVFPLDRTLFMLYISYPITWIITSFVHIMCYIVIYHKRKREYRLSQSL